MGAIQSSRSYSCSVPDNLDCHFQFARCKAIRTDHEMLLSTDRTLLAISQAKRVRGLITFGFLSMFAPIHMPLSRLQQQKCQTHLGLGLNECQKHRGWSLLVLMSTAHLYNSYRQKAVCSLRVFEGTRFDCRQLHSWLLNLIRGNLIRGKTSCHHQLVFYETGQHHAVGVGSTTQHSFMSDV